LSEIGHAFFVVFEGVAEKLVIIESGQTGCLSEDIGLER